MWRIHAGRMLTGKSAPMNRLFTAPHRVLSGSPILLTMMIPALIRPKLDITTSVSRKKTMVAGMSTSKWTLGRVSTSTVKVIPVVINGQRNSQMVLSSTRRVIDDAERSQCSMVPRNISLRMLPA